MSRIGHGQPVPPFAGHGFLGNAPANGVLPGLILVVEPDDRRSQMRRRPTPDPVVGHGFLGNIPANGVLPGPLVNVDRADQLVRFQPLPAITINGLAATVTPPAAINPPPPTNVDRVDQRSRFLPFQPIIISGALATATAPATLPPAPVVVIVPSGPRNLLFPPATAHGFDDVAPPLPEVIGNDDTRERQRRAPAPPVTGAHGFDDVSPPEPEVVGTDDNRERWRHVPAPLVLSGVLAPFLPPFVAPPQPLVVVGEDGRRRRVLPPIVLAGPAFPSGVVAAIYTRHFGVPSPDGNVLDGLSDDGRFGGTPDDEGFSPGTPAGARFKPGSPGRG